MPRARIKTTTYCGFHSVCSSYIRLFLRYKVPYKFMIIKERDSRERMDFGVAVAVDLPLVNALPRARDCAM